MHAENLLTNLNQVFDSSTYTQSEELFKQIVELAAKKLLTQNNNLQELKRELNNFDNIKMQVKDLKSRLADKRKLKRTKRKFITREKLKQSAIKKISRDNKKLHERHFDTKQRQSMKLNHLQSMCKNYLDSLHPENEEEKLQSPQYPCQAKFSPFQSMRDNSSAIEIEIKPNNTLLCPKTHVQKKFKNTRKNFQSYLNSRSDQFKTDELICPICIEILIDPVSTVCGHSFCFRCLDESQLFAATCPVCRLHIKGLQLVPCQYLQQLIKIKCNEFLQDGQTLQVYKSRKEQNETWRKERFINVKQVKQGLLLDVRDTESIWCQAIITKVYSVKSKISSVLVHYLQWAKLYDEIIEIKSCRLAPRNFFTSRTDLLRYNLNQQEENLRGAVITGPNNNNVMNHPIRVERPLSFNSILGLDNLRNSINVFRDNIFSSPQQRNQDRNVFIPLLRESGIHVANPAGFLNQRNRHYVVRGFIDSDSQESYPMQMEQDEASDESQNNWNRIWGPGSYNNDQHESNPQEDVQNNQEQEVYFQPLSGLDSENSLNQQDNELQLSPQHQDQAYRHEQVLRSEQNQNFLSLAERSAIPSFLFTNRFAAENQTEYPIIQIQSENDASSNGQQRDEYQRE